jgi:hypothetical protein
MPPAARHWCPGRVRWHTSIRVSGEACPGYKRPIMDRFELSEWVRFGSRLCGAGTPRPVHRVAAPRPMSARSAPACPSGPANPPVHVQHAMQDFTPQFKIVGE